ncbi:MULTISPECIES: SPW repeat protein [unclassified Variovorax]|uniref:SPW repeat protein n=1 Tax=unclassified Variovorax TaxID=663243 RepID=UPI001315E8C6|nr:MULTISPECIES: SPW repeat protein [unclassified Variovorax]VTU32154.1 SPW repeat [Variovorax sp. SRS16]VTU39053.1 SPW repeat [Variovorax sp. PBL-E5]
MKRLKHWQDLVNAILGVWVILSPWALGFQDTMNAMSNAVLVGLLLIAAALGAIFVPRAWEEWSEGILGLWLIASPWVLDFSMQRDAMLAAVVTGIVIAALALWTLLTDKDYSAGWHRAAH